MEVQDYKDSPDFFTTTLEATGKLKEYELNYYSEVWFLIHITIDPFAWD